MNRIYRPFLIESGKPYRGNLDFRSSLDKHPVGIHFWSRDWFLRIRSGCPATSSSPWTQAFLSPLRALLPRRAQTSTFTPHCSSWVLSSLPVSCFVCFHRVIIQLFIGQWPFRFHVCWSVVIMPDEIYIVPYLTRDQSTFTDTILLIFHTWL